MSLLTLKWLSAIILLIGSLLAGLASLRFITRYQRQLQLGDAVANGIFIGAAAFHLLPDAVEILPTRYTLLAVMYALALTAIAFIMLFLIHQQLLHRKPQQSKLINIALLSVTLTIHALIAGIALGVADDATFVSIIFVAILAHKGFEVFAFVMGLQRQLNNHKLILLLLVVFCCITPLGIWLGSLGEQVMTPYTNTIVTGVFNALAAGTFFYIGTAAHQHYGPMPDSYRQYNQMILTIIGVVLMGLIAIWI